MDSPTNPPTSRLRAALRSGSANLAFVALVAAISAVGSERMFWFWSPDIADHLLLMAFYSIPVVVTLWLIERYQVDSAWSLVLAVPIYAYLTEGFITPVLYSGGPFVPFFPMWFTAWHGMLALGILVFAFRRWLLDENWRALAATSTAIGVFWGVWSSTLRLPENVNDEDMIADIGELVVLEPAAFAGYAATFTAVVMAAHVLLGMVWPRRFTPSRWTVRLVAALVLVGVAAWTVVIPWALPMFAAYVAIQVWALRAHDRSVVQPTLFEQLHGRIPPLAVTPIALMPAAATATYAAVWQLDPSELALQVLMYGTIAVQTLVGGVLMWRSIRIARRRDRPGQSALAQVAIEERV